MTGFSLNKRRWYWTALGILLVILFGLAVWTGSGGGMTIRLTEAEVQQQIDKKVKEGLTFKDVSLTDAKVHFTNEGMEVYLAMKGQRFKKEFTLKGGAVGTPEYDPWNGVFYFKPEQVSVSEFHFGAESFIDKAKKAADRYITDEGLRQAVKDVAPKLKNWVIDMAKRTAMGTLDRVPVYTLKNDAKGIIAQAFLDKVYVQNGELIIKFTLWRLTVWVGMFLFAIVMTFGFMCALLANPGWGMGALVLTAGLDD